ncbi:hypothetical protein IW140_003564 [Coemansia sp. RSA 1813]|nr:hypothetical protein EV178_003470 [Coemansia sp. RSA 1646]KAJ1769168.1 hypothetical protein LPJ74_004284 [Coemansia sp. RSA 1843]KAJ2089127.1 hypothetical protein IW138_003707 [Coemansia sp. RSA 986]KAJ2215616.1 hypothetical protein EV179_002027 [Coemansia sp. RSA 487]KAJ2568807.1 hypothetical protein IW140_003564 [Coemansia sp. RSA 1813]
MKRYSASDSRSSDGDGAAMDKVLPFDILCRIFVQAQWPTLAYVSRGLHEVSLSRAVRARYCLAEFGQKQVLDGRVGLAGRRPRMFRQDLVLLLLNMGADPRADDQWILRHACAQGWEPIVRKLLQMPARAAAPATEGGAAGLDNWRGSTTGFAQGTGGDGARLVDICDDDDAALRIAAGLGQTGVVRLLIGAGADVHAFEDEPLVLAAGNCHAAAVHELLRHGAHAQADNSRALRSAAMAGDANIDVVQVLIDAGARVQALDESCILAACYKGDGEFPRPPLLEPMSACRQSQQQTVRLTQAELLKYSYAGTTGDAALCNTPAAIAPLPPGHPHHRARCMPQRYRNAASGPRSQQQPPSAPAQSACSPVTQPITPAARSDRINMDELAAAVPPAQRPVVTHIGVVRLLLARGANPNARGGRPLVYACARGSIRTAAVLLAYGADAHALGEEPLRAAAEHGHADIVRLLLRAGADVHAKDEAPLRNAARGGHSEVVDDLLAHGASASGRGGVEALRAAARSGWVAVVERLVAAGADANDAEFRSIALRSRELRRALGMREPPVRRSLF